MPLIKETKESLLIGVDSKAIMRTWETLDGEKKSFHGLIGLSISVFKAKDFKEKYEQILEQIFDKYSIEKAKRTYKSADIFKIFAGRPMIAEDFLFSLAQNILAITGIKVNLFFTTLETKRLIEEKLAKEEKTLTEESFKTLKDKKIIPIYGVDSATKNVSVREFLTTIQDSYPAICAWKLTEITHMKGQHFLLDFLTGAEESHAWNQLISYNSVETITRGDQCNAYISATDLVLRAIDKKLDREHLLLNEVNLRKVLLDISGSTGVETNVIRIWNPDIHMIKPIKPVKIQVELFTKHPIICIFNEKNSEHEKKEIENSPLMQELYNMAYGLDGGVIFYDPRFTTQLLKESDIFVTYGSKGEETYKKLRKLDYKLIPKKISEKK